MRITGLEGLKNKYLINMTKMHIFESNYCVYFFVWIVIIVYLKGLDLAFLLYYHEHTKIQTVSRKHW